MPLMLERVSYDTVCHEHLEYYGLSQIKWITDKVGLKIVDVNFNDINGGSFSVTVAQKQSKHEPNLEEIEKILAEEERFQRLSPYRTFSDRVTENGIDFRRYSLILRQMG